ncbi:hypothetical protein [Paenibacillus harenae]|uniref:hypothetical protein n=1 Tax=Paenibacillus harenae TaxID=306543 RepID=UPI00048E316A|nr:hypothetical protein [Paenibacillus harenae]
MFWTIIWFIVNMLFVASAITYLFMHRSYTEAKRQMEDARHIARLNLRRKLVGAFSIVWFAAMVTSFIINMRLNG